MSRLGNIRLACEEDAPAVATLFAQLGYPASADEMRARIAAMIGEHSHWCAVAEQGDRLIGCCHVFSSLILEAGLVAQHQGSWWMTRGAAK